MKVNVSGHWKEGVPWVKVGNTWKKAVAEWVKVGNVWKKVSYAFTHININTTMEEVKLPTRAWAWRVEDPDAFHMDPPEYQLDNFEATAESSRSDKNKMQSAHIKLTFNNDRAGIDEKARLLAALKANTAYIRFKASSTYYMDLNGTNCRFADIDSHTFQMNASAIAATGKLIRTAATGEGECFVEIVYKD